MPPVVAEGRLQILERPITRVIIDHDDDRVGEVGDLAESRRHCPDRRAGGPVVHDDCGNFHSSSSGEVESRQEFVSSERGGHTGNGCHIDRQQHANHEQRRLEPEAAPAAGSNRLPGESISEDQPHVHPARDPGAGGAGRRGDADRDPGPRDRLARRQRRGGAREDQVLLKANPLEILASLPSRPSLAPRAPFSRRWSRRCGSAADPMAAYEARRLLRRGLPAEEVARRQRPRHVHAHFGTNAAAVAMFCRWLGGPGIASPSTVPTSSTAPCGSALREKVEAAAFVCVISSFCRSQLYRWTRLRRLAKIHVVRCALEPSYFEARGRRGDHRQAAALCVGRLSEEKGQLLWCARPGSWSTAASRSRSVLAGDGPLRGEIEPRSSVSGWKRRCG